VVRRDGSPRAAVEMSRDSRNAAGYGWVRHKERR